MNRLFSLLVCLLIAHTAVSGETPQAQSPADKLGWQMAIHSYTYRLFPFNEAVDKTVGLGLKYMSISGNLNINGTNQNTVKLSKPVLEGVEAKLKSAGIVKLVNMGVVTLSTNEAESRRVYEFAKKMGIDTLVAEPEPAAMDTVEKLCKEYNIKVAIHNHPKPSRYWNPDTVLQAIKGRSPLIGACGDTGHWVRSGLDPLECLKKLEGHIITLHFKDLSEKSPKAHDVAWGTGISNAKGMMEELKRQKYQGAFCVEYEYHWENSTPEIAECVKFFNATCAELAASPDKH
jgi:sugar phosphate isomerase/epimerase